MKRAVWLVATALVCIGCKRGPLAKSADAKASARAVPDCPVAATVDADAQPAAAAPIVHGAVARICFFGSTRWTEAQLRDALVSAVGQPFDEEHVRADIHRLYSLGDFEDVRVDAEALPSGVVLVYLLRERPLIDELRFEGAMVLSEADVRQAFRVDEHLPFDEARVRRQAAALTREYRSRGYLRAAVTTSHEAVAGSGVRVRVQIAPGPLVRVASLAFKGAQAVKVADLAKTIETARGDRYWDEALNRDALLITAYYYDRGMIRAEVHPTMTLASDPSAAVVTFEIKEGAVYTLGDVKVDGDLALPAGHPTLREAKPGAVFCRKKLNAELDEIKAAYARIGIDADVTPETDLHADISKVDIVFRVTQKPRTR